MLEKDVPNVQASVHAGGEEDSRTGCAPATIRQNGVVVLGPHDRRLLGIL